jgi:hypothetical protein
MTLLDDPTLTLIRHDLRNHTETVGMHQSGMRRPADELARGYASAVETIAKLLAHIEAIDNNTTITEVVYGGLSFVYARERWSENHADEGAFVEMGSAYAHLKDAVDAYNMSVFESDAT